MGKFFLWLFLLICTIKFGFDYITSDDFQMYGDKTKEPWTCKATIYLGDLYQVLDSPAVAKTYYDRVPARCPKTLYAAEAAFGSAYSIDQMDQAGPAVDAYNKFIEEYKESSYVKDAKKNINRIQHAKGL